MRLVLHFLLLFAASAAADDYPGAPASVVVGYLEADGAGLARDVKTARQLLRFTTWKEAPGGKSAVVIRSYDIGEVGWTDDEAYVQITYEVLGRLDGLEFTSQPAKEEIFFEVIKTKGRWKIVSPPLPPHLFVAAAIAALEAAGTTNHAKAKTALEKLRPLE